MSATAFGNFGASAVLVADDLNQLGGAWHSYTPTFSNLTIGNGSVSAVYEQIGRTVLVRITITLGDTSSVTGHIGFSLPVTAASANHQSLAYLADAGSPYLGLLLFTSTTTAAFYAIGAGGTYATGTAVSSTVPFTWASTDTLRAVVAYEAAANAVAA